MASAARRAGRRVAGIADRCVIAAGVPIVERGRSILVLQEAGRGKGSPARPAYFGWDSCCRSQSRSAPSHADATYFQAGILVMACFLKLADSLKDAQLCPGATSTRGPVAGLAAVILGKQGRLPDDVLVIAMGEFGRTPTMGTQGSTDGRNH